MARIYLASSWRNPYQPQVVCDLRAAGHHVYDFRNPPYRQGGFAWSDLDRSWEKWSAEAYRKHLLTSPVASAGYVADMRAMEWADTCLLLLPCGRSAHLEAGWFKGRGKRLIIWTRDGEEPELMAMMADAICINSSEVFNEL